MKLYLASKSPRRRQLLSEMGFRFSVLDCETDENVKEGTHPKEAVEILARRKSLAGSRLVEEDDVVIGSDTLVELGGKALGKPKNEEDALRMLLSLSGKTHRVYTGVAVTRNGRMLSGVEETSVTFRNFDSEEARAYVMTGEPMDKAGSYGIQGLGGKLVDHIDGNLDNVIGFPKNLMRELWEEIQ